MCDADEAGARSQPLGLAALARFLLQRHLVLAEGKRVDGGEQFGRRDGEWVALLVYALLVHQHHLERPLSDPQK